jgi:DNA-binding transcriptional MocR family regulator
MLLHLDKADGRSKAGQILEQIRGHLERRELRTGERLPSTRRLAAQLGVHRSTVAIAYQELWAQGWIELRPGALPRVRPRLLPPAAQASARDQGFPWAEWAGPACEQLMTERRAAPQVTREPGVIDFRPLGLDPRLLPVDAFRACLNRVLRRQGTALLEYGDCEGYLPLRRYLARRLATHGIHAGPEEILVTNGSQHGLDLVFRMAAAPGRWVAVESPTYDHVLPILHLHGLRPVGIPLTGAGLDLAALEARMREGPPALVYTMPTFQNPTGRCSAQAEREALLALCRRHRVPILEDGFEEEMKYFGKLIPPIKAMDTDGQVIYCGTFSKILFPGIRVGWVVAARTCIERLAALRQASELAPPMALQAAMHDFCEGGHYDLHLSRMHRVFRKRMLTALDALKRHLDPAWAAWSEPNGGYIVWLQLAPPADPEPGWAARFAARGVRVTPGDSCFPEGDAGGCIRLSIATLDEEELAEGIRRIAAALEDAHGRRSRIEGLQGPAR